MIKLLFIFYFFVGATQNNKSCYKISVLNNSEQEILVPKFACDILIYDEVIKGDTLFLFPKIEAVNYVETRGAPVQIDGKVNLLLTALEPKKRILLGFKLSRNTFHSIRKEQINYIKISHKEDSFLLNKIDNKLWVIYFLQHPNL